MIYQTTLNMKKILITFLSMIMLLNATNAFAWGAKGHDIVAAIAEQHLTRKAKKNISKILDGKSIVYYSSWMDNIQNSPYWKNGYNKTKTWHYANVDKGLTYQTMQKNENGDVVMGLEFLTKEMTENYAELTDSMRVDYLKMIVHLVGDLHCPMHAGRLSDRGGNGTRVMWFRSESSLHSIWDSKMIDSARKWSYSEWCDQLDIKNRKYRKNISKGTYEEWFTDTVEDAARIYDYVESSSAIVPELSYQFVYDFSPLLEEQLLNAGYRLAHVLNTIFK